MSEVGGISPFLPTTRFGDYQITTVFGAIPLEVREAVIRFWHHHGVLVNPAMAMKRSDELAMTIEDADQTLVGVATVYEADFIKPGDRYYYFRMFIRPQDRVPGLMRFVAVRTREYLRYRPARGRPKGIIHVNENPKLMAPGMRKLFQRNGYEHMGVNARGHDVWRALF